MHDIRLAAFVALSLTFGGAAAQPAADPNSDLLEAAQAAKGDPARGKQAFEACAACHRASGPGRSDGAVPRLAGQHATVIVKQVADIRAGRRINDPMKPYVIGNEITAQSLADIAAHLQALPVTGTPGKGPGTAVERGRVLFARDCAPCHGANAEGIPEAAHPTLAAQHYGYLVRELVMIRDGTRGNSNPGMVATIKTYPPADMEAVADYLSRLPPLRRP